MNSILFEIDEPTTLPRLINYSPGVWVLPFVNEVVEVTDDDGVTGYYNWTNDVFKTVQSLRVDQANYARTISLNDCLAVRGSFYYDVATTKIYVHFENSEPQLSKIVFAGTGNGYTYTYSLEPYFNGIYYAPKVVSISSIKKSIDPLFFGKLKFQSSNVDLINNDGEFDDWRSRDLYGARCRILYGENEDYTTFSNLGEGNISDDSRSWTSFGVEITDPRQDLTQPVATRLTNSTEFPNIADNAENKFIPVNYGKILNQDCIMIDGAASPTPTNYTFIFTDTKVSSVASLDKVYQDGTERTPLNVDLDAGTFKLPVAQSTGDITADFTMSITNGVEIIADLVGKYDNRPYLPSFWDIEETNSAIASARNTSIAVDAKSKKLFELIEQVASDIGGRFFVKDNGLFTVRLYDIDREISKIIERDEFLGEPEIENNSSEFLSSVVIKYNHDRSEDEFDQLVYDVEEAEVFERYKKLKTDEFETGLYTLAEATAKAEEIMSVSGNVADIIRRSVTWENRTIELCDFIACDPVSRVSEAETKKVYEVIGIEKNIDNLTLNLELRYVRDYIVPELEYSILVFEDLNMDDEHELVTESGESIVTELGESIIVFGSQEKFVTDENNNLIYGVDEI